MSVVPSTPATDAVTGNALRDGTALSRARTDHDDPRPRWRRRCPRAAFRRGPGRLHPPMSDLLARRVMRPLTRQTRHGLLQRDRPSGDPVLPVRRGPPLALHRRRACHAASPRPGPQANPQVSGLCPVLAPYRREREAGDRRSIRRQTRPQSGAGGARNRVSGHSPLSVPSR